MVFSALISDELVLLARVSFAGTSMIAPVVLSAVIFQKPPKSILILSAIALSYFVLSLLGWVPSGFAGLPTDAAMYLILIPATAILMLVHHFQNKNIHAA